MDDFRNLDGVEGVFGVAGAHEDGDIGLVQDLKKGENVLN